MSQSNGQQTINAAGWTNIGTGPLTINLQSLSLSVNVVVSDSQPADNALGNVLYQARPQMQVSNTQAVWARVMPNWANQAGTAVIDVLLGTPGSGGGGGGGSKMDFAIMNYKAIAAATGMAVGDLIQQIEAWDTTGSTPSYVSTVWRNVTQEATLGSAPSAANIAPLSASATTVSVSNMPSNLAQEAGGNLAAILTKLGTTLAVSAAALPLPNGAATAANQPALNGDGGALAHITNFPATQPVTPAATENHLGEVGGNVKRITPTIVNLVQAYTAGMIVGGGPTAGAALIELQNAARVANGTGLITSARLGTKVSNSSSVQFDLVLFTSKPTGTYTDGAVFAIATADLPLVSKVLHISDWTQLGTAASHGQAPAEPRFFQCSDTVNSATSLWGLLVVRGSLTLATTGDLALSLSVQRN